MSVFWIASLLFSLLVFVLFLTTSKVLDGSITVGCVIFALTSFIPVFNALWFCACSWAWICAIADGKFRKIFQKKKKSFSRRTK